MIEISNPVKDAISLFEKSFNTTIEIEYVPENEIGYAETPDNFFKNRTNSIRIFCGNNTNKENILSNTPIEDTDALKIIESLFHELRHVEQRLHIIREHKEISKIISLEYLCSRKSRWYDKNYEKTVLEADAELYGYIKLFEFVNETKNLDLQTKAVKLFTETYKSIISEDKLERISSAKNIIDSQNLCLDALEEILIERKNQTRGLLFSKSYKDYLESTAKKFIKSAPWYIRKDEQICKLLDISPSLEENKNLNNKLIERDERKGKGLF